MPSYMHILSGLNSSLVRKNYRTSDRPKVIDWANQRGCQKK